MATTKQKVSVRLHDGTTYETEIENYDPKKLADELSKENTSMVSVGEVVAHRTSFASIVPIKE